MVVAVFLSDEWPCVAISLQLWEIHIVNSTLIEKALAWIFSKRKNDAYIALTISTHCDKLWMTVNAEVEWRTSNRHISRCEDRLKDALNGSAWERQERHANSEAAKQDNWGHYVRPKRAQSQLQSGKMMCSVTLYVHVCGWVCSMDVQVHLSYKTLAMLV